jgi:hypothetical protein
VRPGVGDFAILSRSADLLPSRCALNLAHVSASCALGAFVRARDPKKTHRLQRHRLCAHVHAPSGVDLHGSTIQGFTLMFRHKITQQKKLLRAAAVLLPLCVLVAVTPARAQTWLLKVSEKEMQLAHPNDMMWMKVNMWDNSYQRMMARSMPTFELQNLQPAGGPALTELQLTIGDTRFRFDDDFLGAFALLGDSTPGIDLTSSVSANENVLTVNIGNGGLDPGEIVRFRIALAPDAGQPDPPFFAHPDYRTVLFDMNGNQVYGPDPSIPAGQDDNSQATVKFSNGTTAGPATFVDEVITGIQGDYFNNIFRPYGLMEPVDIFEIGGGPNVPIPEPASALLMLCASFGVLWISARRRRVSR